MAAISKAKHDKLVDDTKTFLSRILQPIDLKPCLQKEALQLQLLFDNYIVTLSQLQAMIKEYEIRQRKMKVELRKQQLIHAKNQ